jgi:hypothetical protein
METVASLLSSRRQRRFSATRLRYLYADLLEQLDTSPDTLEPRQVPHAFIRTHASIWSYWKSYAAFAHQRHDDGRHQDVDSAPSQKQHALAVAFRLLAATRSADKEGANGGARIMRDDAMVTALAHARHREARVTELVRQIGEVLVNAEQPALTSNRLRSDEVFEYFCEKAMLTLLVDIVKETPQTGTSRTASPEQCLHGVVWSPLVKAQVLHTVSLLVSGVRDPSALYFILSHNCINELIACILPLQQWTDPALEIMLPLYVGFIKTLSLQLSGSPPQLFPFFAVHEPANNHVYFPLFTATLDTATSTYAQSNAYVHFTCLNLIVDLMQIQFAPIREWIRGAEREQGLLARHLATLLRRRSRRIANLATGPVVDGVRSNAIVGQLNGLHEEIDALNDVFFCGIQELNVRLCEELLQTVVSVLLSGLLPSRERKFLMVGILDADVIPEKEALAQVSVFVLAKLFQRLEYAPLVRMLAVALLHPQSAPLWTTTQPQATRSPDYIFTSALNSIVAGKMDNDMDNPYRSNVFQALRGEFGLWRVPTAAMLLEAVLESPALDADAYRMLTLLSLTPNAAQTTFIPTVFETSLESVLLQHHTALSPVCTIALECVTSLALQVLYISSVNTEKIKSPHVLPVASLLWNALLTTKKLFYQRTLESQQLFGVSDLFVDLIESIVQGRYQRLTMSTRHGIPPVCRFHAYQLGQHGCTAYATTAETIIRKLRGATSNDMEVARFNALMAIHFRAVCRVTERFWMVLEQTRNSSVSSPPQLCRRRSPVDPMARTDPADELGHIFGALRERSPIGTDLDLRGRMTFRCTASDDGTNSGSSAAFAEPNETKPTSMDELILVLDPMDVYVTRPRTKAESLRGIVLCALPLLNVIAAAGDGAWLHVAVRHENVPRLIQNGNLTLCFESPGACLIVVQYLDRCRQILRRELLDQITQLFVAHNVAVIKEECSSNAIITASGSSSSDRERHRDSKLQP